MKANANGKWWSATWSPVTGCKHDFPCWDRCWARDMVKRLHLQWGMEEPDFVPTFHPDWLEWPLHWKKPRVVFCCGMGDLFAPGVPESCIWRVWWQMSQTPRHTYVLLTKRIDRALDFIAPWHDRVEYRTAGDGYVGTISWPLPNLVLGTSVSTQAEWDERVRKLCEIPAWRRVVSVEPMLGPIDMRGIDLLNLPPGSIRWNAPIHGIICGGESGPGARPMHPDWVRSVREQCKAAGVDFYFKQWGEWGPLDDWRERLSARQLYDNRPRVRFVRLDGQDTLADGDQDMAMVRVGKKRAGRVLDGHTHDSLAWETKGVRQ